MSDEWYRKGGRAIDDAQKDEIIARLGALWKANRSLRLMQLLGNVFRSDPYYIEDYEAMKILEDFYRRDPGSSWLRC